MDTPAEQPTSGRMNIRIVLITAICIILFIVIILLMQRRNATKTKTEKYKPRRIRTDPQTDWSVVDIVSEINDQQEKNLNELNS